MNYFPQVASFIYLFFLLGRNDVGLSRRLHQNQIMYKTNCSLTQCKHRKSYAGVFQIATTSDLVSLQNFHRLQRDEAADVKQANAALRLLCES